MELPLPNSWVELHGALTHFPIVLLLVSAFFEAGSLLPRQSTERRAWYRQVSLSLLVLMVISALPSLLSGYMTGREMPRPPVGFDAHWKAAVVSSVLAAAVLLWRVLSRDQMRAPVRAAMLVLFVGSVFAVSLTGHLGGEMVLGGGDYEPVPVAAAIPTPSAIVRAPGALESAAGKMEVAAGKLDNATERLALAAGAANAARAESAAQRAQAAAQTSTQAAQSARSARPAPVASNAEEALARRLEAVASRYERVADRLGTVAERLAAAPLPTTAPASAQPAPTNPRGRVAVNPASATPSPASSAPTPPAATTPPASETGPSAQLIAAGQRVYVSEDLGCTSCHKLNGRGGRGGPDLTGTGTRHPDLAWQIAHLRNPARVVPGSRMPAYGEDEINAHDIEALAAYMVSLK